MYVRAPLSRNAEIATEAAAAAAAAACVTPRAYLRSGGAIMSVRL